MIAKCLIFDTGVTFDPIFQSGRWKTKLQHKTVSVCRTYDVIWIHSVLLH